MSKSIRLSVGLTLVCLALAPRPAFAQAGHERGAAARIDHSPPAPEPRTPSAITSAVEAPPRYRGLAVYDTRYFTLRTDAEPEYAKLLASRLDDYHEKLTAGLHAAFQTRIRIPKTAIILFERQEDYQRYANQNAPQLTNNGGYYDGGTKTIVTYRYNNSMQLYFHEIIHAVMGELFSDPFFYRYTRPNWPIWFDEGLAELYGSFRLHDDGTFEIGTINPGKLSYLVNAMATNTFVDLRTLLKSPPERFSGGHMNIYYAASWGLVSYLMQHPVYSQRLPLFLMRLRNNQDGLEAFKELFGEDMEALNRDWRAYLTALAVPQTNDVTLFNGKSIEDWTIHEGGSWKVDGGAIEAEGNSSYNYLIRSELPYQMFTIRLGLRLDKGTAGVILGNNFHGEYPYYYLIDFSQNRVAVRRSYSATHIEVIRSVPARLPQGEWADVAIRITGERLVVSIDDRTLVEIGEDRDRYSLFGLYLYNAKAGFRDLHLQAEPIRPTGPR